MSAIKDCTLGGSQLDELIEGGHPRQLYYVRMYKFRTLEQTPIMAENDTKNYDHVDFNDDETTCPKCGAFGVYTGEREEVRDTIKAKFICNNKHTFWHIYPIKGEKDKD